MLHPVMNLFYFAFSPPDLSGEGNCTNDDLLHLYIFSIAEGYDCKLYHGCFEPCIG